MPKKVWHVIDCDEETQKVVATDMVIFESGSLEFYYETVKGRYLPILAYSRDGWLRVNLYGAASEDMACGLIDARARVMPVYDACETEDEQTSEDSWTDSIRKAFSRIWGD